jgi:hypothetical protein
MITDKLPKKVADLDEYRRSDALLTLDLPAVELFRDYVQHLEEAMKKEDRRQVQRECNGIAVTVCEKFAVKAPKVQILGVRPLEETGNRIEELFGDYDFESARIRLWMRTAVLEKMTAFGTLTSTLCHEICHHLDVVKLDLPNTFHTRGFYERAAVLYHQVRGTPVRPLVWDRLSNGTYRINWTATMRRLK